MKTLIVSVKSSSEVLRDFERALKKARSGRLKKTHHEISFDNHKYFGCVARFV